MKKEELKKLIDTAAGRIFAGMRRRVGGAGKGDRDHLCEAFFRIDLFVP